MPVITNSETGKSFEVADDMLEVCPRCEGAGKYNYFPNEGGLKRMFSNWIGTNRCLGCKGSGKILTDEGRSFVRREEFKIDWQAMTKTTDS